MSVFLILQLKEKHIIKLMEGTEDTNLEFIYNTIAHKFSHTRYKVWDKVKNVLDSFKPNTLNIDMGCGNGKNMLYRKDLSFIGIDFSKEFVDICLKRNLVCYKSDIRYTIFDNNVFDNSICVAVLHHLDSKQKRVTAINEMFRITKTNGTLFIYVWALKQPHDSRFNFTNNDMMIPFELDGKKHYRYYHLYDENELEYEVNDSIYKFEVLDKGYEKGNYFIHLKKM